MTDLSTFLTSGLTLRTPLVAASGTFGYGMELADLSDGADLGALVTPTVTLQARMGSAMPRTAEVSAGMLHSLGLPNPGLAGFVSEKMPALRGVGCPVIVSLLGEELGEWVRLAEGLTAAGGVTGLELNLSPVDWRQVEREAEVLARIERVVRAVRGATDLPLIAKLPAMGADVGLMAQAAEAAGAEIVSVSQAFPGVAVRLSSRQFRLPDVVGGLSGPCIKPLALYQVWRVAQSVALPVIGGGGVMNGSDALEFLVAGATAVSVGIANIIHPGAIRKMHDEVSDYGNIPNSLSPRFGISKSV